MKYGVINLDKLKAIRTFIAIAEQGSLTQAAKRLDTSLPTVVRTLAALEDDIGSRLFNRSTRVVDLTEEGQRYLGHVRQMIDGLAQVEGEMSGTLSKPTGPVTVTAPQTFGSRYVAPGLLAIKSEHPAIIPRLMLADRIVNILEDHVDVAVRIGHLRDSSLKARTIGHVRQVLCATPDCIAANKPVLTPEDLRGLPCILNDGNTSGQSWPFLSDSGRVTPVPVSAAFTSNAVGPTLDACLAGTGFGLFLSYQVDDAIRDGSLVTLLDAFQPPPLPVRIVRPDTPVTPGRIKVVADGLQDYIRECLPAN
ncbi:MAG: LysR family transcriptional regulator [Alphaproteobacteria bacterium]|nr:LysR family transcriptional regulator [Alphaproteobacteria bacterium]